MPFIVVVLTCCLPPLFCLLFGIYVGRSSAVLEMRQGKLSPNAVEGGSKYVVDPGQRTKE